MMLFWILLALFFILLILFCILGNKRKLQTVSYSFQSEKIKEPLRFVLLADLHGTYYGMHQEHLLLQIDRQHPDAVLLAGDIFDEKTSPRAAEILLSELGKRYPCYYVTGNHEYRKSNLKKFLDIVEKTKVHYLNDESVFLTVRGQTIQISGMNDVKSLKKATKEEIDDKFHSMYEKADKRLFSVFLYHHPHGERFVDCGFDLVVSGHVHGGQIRIPGVMNGIFSPDTGFFPKYAGGCYALGNTHLVVSRGLMVNWRPRIYNPPEIVSITVEPATSEKSP